MAEIELHSPAGSWKDAFDQASRWLRSLVGAVPTIEHIGSTSIPDLDAKPVLDIVIGADARDLAPIAHGLEAHGFVAGSPAGPAGSSFFLSRPAADGRPPINLHLTAHDSRQWRDLVRFRDSLRNDAALARRYADLKRCLAARSGGDLDRYTAGKSAFVARVLGSRS